MAKKKSPNQILDKESMPAIDQPTILTPEWQEATAEKSRKRGWVYLGELPFLLACDPTYDVLIPKLWASYQLYLRGPKIPPCETPGNRIEAWTKLVDRWAFGMVGGVPGTDPKADLGLEDISYLSLHRYDAINGTLIHITDRRNVSVDYIVTLGDLRKYLAEEVDIPIPQALYPESEKKAELNQMPHALPPPSRPSDPDQVNLAQTGIDPDQVMSLAAKGQAFTHGPKHDRLDNRGKAMKKAFTDFCKSEKRPPTAFLLWDWIPEGGAIQEKEHDPKTIYWKRADGSQRETSFKSFQNRYTNLKKKLIV